ncbi:trypsin-like peptidase domain-containing protein [Antarctobacter sp.]|uniref:trypsin-like peptidase domain-containing protein n=1 Tax=Antarctobacter sp. TaxID=1872577 RepID=UPI003A8FD402
MRVLQAIAIVVFGLFGGAAQAQSVAECDFDFDVDTESTKFPNLLIDGEVKKGFWLSINRAPPRIKALGRYVGILQVCLMTPDGQPRSVTHGGKTAVVKSPMVNSCTATLLPDNRLLTNKHCYYDAGLVSAGFTIVREARITFGYTSPDSGDKQQTYLVSNREIAANDALDAMLLQIVGGDANTDLGGHIPLRETPRVEPLQDLIMIHHPAKAPQQYSTGTCQIHRLQSEIAPERSPLRHSCESTGGSSGSLLFDGDTLAVVGLHNQGGLSPKGDSFNGGHKFTMINDAFDLGFFDVAKQSEEGITPAAQALDRALQQDDPKRRLDMLASLITDFPGSKEAAEAARLRESAASDALVEAQIIEDAEPQTAALQAILSDFPDSRAAVGARRFLDRRAKADFDTALDAARTLADLDSRIAALQDLLKRHEDDAFSQRIQIALQEARTLKNAALGPTGPTTGPAGAGNRVTAKPVDRVDTPPADRVAEGADVTPRALSFLDTLGLTMPAETGLPEGWSPMLIPDGFARRVDDLAVTEDGARLLVLNGADGLVIRDAEDLSLIARVPLEHPEGKLVLLPGTDKAVVPLRAGELLIVLTQTGETVDRFRYIDGDNTPIDAMNLAPDNRTLAIAHGAAKVTLIDLVDQRPIRTLDMPKAVDGTDFFMTFTADSKALIVMDGRTMAGVTTQGRQIFLRENLPDRFWVGLSHGDRLLRVPGTGEILAGFGEGSVAVIDPKTGETLREWAHHRDYHIAALAMSGDGSSVISTGRAYDIAMTDLATGDLLWDGAFSGKIYAEAIAVNPPLDRVYFGRIDGGIEMRSLSSGDWLGFHPAPGRYNASTAALRGTRIALADQFGVVDLWEISGDKAVLLNSLATLEEREYGLGWDFPCCGALGNLSISDDGKLVAASQDGRVVTWEAETGRVLADRELAGDGWGAGELALVPGSDQLLLIESAEGKTSLVLLDAITLDEVRRIDEPVESPDTIRVSPNGRRALVSQSESGAGALISLPNMAMIAVFEAGRWGGDAAGFIEDGARFLILEESQVRYFDGMTGAPLENQARNPDTFRLALTPWVLGDPETGDLQSLDARTSTEALRLPPRLYDNGALLSLADGRHAMLTGDQFALLDLARGDVVWTGLPGEADTGLHRDEIDTLGPDRAKRLQVWSPEGDVLTLAAFRDLRDSLIPLYTRLQTLPEQPAEGAESREAAEVLMQLLAQGDPAVRRLLVEDRAAALSENLRKEIQQVLKAQGYYTMQIDGDVGKGTLAAMKAFVTANRDR